MLICTPMWLFSDPGGCQLKPAFVAASGNFWRPIQARFWLEWLEWKAAPSTPAAVLAFKSCPKQLPPYQDAPVRTADLPKAEFSELGIPLLSVWCSFAHSKKPGRRRASSPLRPF
jgi:hypothetical protein